MKVCLARLNLTRQSLRCRKCNQKHVICFGQWDASGSDVRRFMMEVVKEAWLTAVSCDRGLLSTYSGPCSVLGRPWGHKLQELTAQ